MSAVSSISAVPSDLVSTASFEPNVTIVSSVSALHLLCPACLLCPSIYTCCASDSCKYPLKHLYQINSQYGVQSNDKYMIVN